MFWLPPDLVVSSDMLGTFLFKYVVAMIHFSDFFFSNLMFWCPGPLGVLHAENQEMIHLCCFIEICCQTSLTALKGKPGHAVISY